MKKNSVVSVVRYFILIIVKWNSEASVVSVAKRRSERSQIYDISVTYDRETISQWYVLTQPVKVVWYLNLMLLTK